LLGKILDWIVRLPTLTATGVVIGICIGLSILTMAVCHAAIPKKLRTEHNDVAGFTLAVVGVVYAVLLAFIAVAIWENYDRAGNLVQIEAALVGDLDRNTVGLPEPLSSALRKQVTNYAETVVQLEWPALAGGEVLEGPGWESLDRFHLLLAQDHTQDPAVIGTKSEILRRLNDLYDARRSRFQSAQAELPPILWWNLLAGAALVMIFCCFFGVPNIWMHAAMMAMLAGSMGLVLSLVLLLYNPFVGYNHVSAAPFNHLVTSLEARGGQAAQ
jgi:Protein of unknown function (DUF4239)